MGKRLIVIGGGPGGYVAAIRAAQLGAEVHLIEKNSLGGACLNVGCVPTKTLLHTAELYRRVLAEAQNGLLAEHVRVNWSLLQERKAAIVGQMVSRVSGLLKANKIIIHSGRAVLENNTTVRVEGANGDVATSLTAEAIVLAVGSKPLRPSFPGADLAGVIDSTEALSLPQAPLAMTIIGGGVIGIELAALYNALGTKVTVMELLPRILPQTDGQVAALLRQKLSENGIRFLTGSELKEVKKEADNLVAKVIFQGALQELPAEKVLIAVGRRPDTQNIGLEALGIEMRLGSIVASEHFETNIPGVYAIGDCNGEVMLAHAASAQGVAAVEHALLGKCAVYRKDAVPACIYTSPEVASVGLTEEQAKEQGLAYKIGLFTLAANAKAVIEGRETGLVKIISGVRYGEILGAHLVGPHATDIIAELALAINLEATVEDLVSTIHAHPTFSEAVGEAAHAALGNPIHWPPGISMGLPAAI